MRKYINKKYGVELYNGDCHEVMATLRDKSFNLVLTDPPYNINKAKWDKWKKVSEYIKFMGDCFKQYERLLKSNGSFYFFHNDFMQLTELHNYINNNTEFVFNSFIIWHKKNFRTFSWKNPSEKCKLRRWFNVCEYMLYYTFQDQTGLKTVMHDKNNFLSLRQYFKQLQEYIGLNTTQISKVLGHKKADHCLRWKGKQWSLPTKETYQQLIDVFHIDQWEGFREYDTSVNEFKNLRNEYEGLRQEYEKLRYTHNLDNNHHNVWRSDLVNSGKLHPTEKPLDIIERIVKCSSNEGDLVLDSFMGSGTTGVACIKTGRRFVGIEKEERYFDIAVKRIQKEI